jgi:hypothetical protein
VEDPRLALAVPARSERMRASLGAVELLGRERADPQLEIALLRRRRRSAPATPGRMQVVMPFAHRRRGRAIAAVLACTLLAACGGDDEPRTERITVAVDRASGKRAKATANGIVQTPVAVAIRASAAPKQRVVVSWGLSCPKSDRKRDQVKGTGGTYTTTPPNVRALELPKRAIAFCAVNATAQLTRSGRIRVTVLASRR